MGESNSECRDVHTSPYWDCTALRYGLTKLIYPIFRTPHCEPFWLIDVKQRALIDITKKKQQRDSRFIGFNQGP